MMPKAKPKKVLKQQQKLAKSLRAKRLVVRKKPKPLKAPPRVKIALAGVAAVVAAGAVRMARVSAGLRMPRRTWPKTPPRRAIPARPRQTPSPGRLMMCLLPWQQPRKRRNALPRLRGALRPPHRHRNLSRNPRPRLSLSR
jgi:hypothetical protein